MIHKRPPVKMVPAYGQPTPPPQKTDQMKTGYFKLQVLQEIYDSGTKFTVYYFIYFAVD